MQNKYALYLILFSLHLALFVLPSRAPLQPLFEILLRINVVIEFRLCMLSTKH